MTIAPLGELRLPESLSGKQGENRAQGHNQLGVDDDLRAVQLFLSEYATSKNTYSTYRKEIERLILWSVIERHRPLSSLTREDFVAYEAFLANPTPRERWCGSVGGRGRQRYGAGWRPFVGPLSPRARQLALVVVNSLLSYLVKGGYLAGNPLSLLRRSKKVPSTTGPMEHLTVARRSLDDEQWAAVLAALEGSKESPHKVARLRILLALLHFLALRISEVESLRMGDFVEVRGKYWVFIVGKGGKPARLPVNGELLAALCGYRRFLGLPPLPGDGNSIDRSLPLIMTQQKRGISARRMNQMLKGLLQKAAAILETHGAPNAPEKAAHLRRASAHWFRHTSLTRQVEKGVPLLHLKENARHSKLDTTLIYVHIDDEQRQLEAEKHTWR